MVSILKIFILLIFLSVNIFPQTTKEIRQKNEELNSLNSEIYTLESRLKEKSNKTKETYQLIQNIKNQILLRQKLTNKLAKEVERSERNISQLEAQIVEINNEISEIKNLYSKYILWLYKNMGKSDWEYLLGSESINQAIVRYQYMSNIHLAIDEKIEKLEILKNEAEKIESDLENELEEKEKLIRAKQSELQNLESKKKKESELVSRLQKDSKNLSKAIREKRSAELKIKNLIADLMKREIERLKKIEETKLKKAKDDKIVESHPVEINYSTMSDFKKLKGKLIWPVKNASVARRYGKNKNKKLNTVTLNYGIDLKTKRNSEIHAVADGVVSVIDWIPGYGSVLILTHRGNFRTVYGNIANFEVEEGDRIEGGKKIGTVEKSIDGDILHFEIWNERESVNPKYWLRK